ncbi:hypothetical protein BC829DRAFT_390424, partial [Chytridium lagenaria]
HNSLHAADVLHCIHYLLHLPTIRPIFTDLEILSILVAALIHDFDHPRSAFEVMSRKECHFLGSLDRNEFRNVRENVVEMVLATDLGKHFELLTMFKKKVVMGDSFDPVGVREDRTLLMQMLMKCADVSNPTKSLPEYNEWIRRITEEWFTQATSQASFIDFIVGPLFDAFGNWCELGEVKEGLERNRKMWAGIVVMEKMAAEKEKMGRKRNKSVPHLPGLITGRGMERSRSQYQPGEGRRQRRLSTPVEALRLEVREEEEEV